MVAQKSLVLLAATFVAARSQAPVGGELGGAHVARYLRGREDEGASCASTVSPIALSVLAALASPAEKHSEVRYTSRETGYREVR